MPFPWFFVIPRKHPFWNTETNFLWNSKSIKIIIVTKNSSSSRQRSYHVLAKNSQGLQPVISVNVIKGKKKTYHWRDSVYSSHPQTVNYNRNQPPTCIELHQTSDTLGVIKYFFLKKVNYSNHVELWKKNDYLFLHRWINQSELFKIFLLTILESCYVGTTKYFPIT